MDTGTDAGVAIAAEGGTVNAGGARTGGCRPVVAAEGRGDGDGCGAGVAGTDPVVSTWRGRGGVTACVGAGGGDGGGVVTDLCPGAVQVRSLPTLPRSLPAGASR